MGRQGTDRPSPAALALCLGALDSLHHEPALSVPGPAELLLHG